ncbi:MAG: carbohydrate ABC transporter permease, partial [Mesorhizobium sp.]
MSTTAKTAPRGLSRRRMRVDGWRWAGRIFLVFMLLYTAVPMIWMLITS